MEADNKLMKKNKKIASNFYIPPPARKSENCPRVVLNEPKSKDRSAEKFKNENMKICNNSSLLFKSDETSSNHTHTLQTSVKKKRKRKKKRNLKKDCDLQNCNEHNVSNENPLSAETLESADCQSLDEIGPFMDLSLNANISVLSFKSNEELSTKFSEVVFTEHHSVKKDEIKQALNGSSTEYSNETFDDSSDINPVETRLEYPDDNLINGCLTNQLNISHVTTDSLEVNESAKQIYGELEKGCMTSEIKPMSSTFIDKTSNSSNDELITESSELLCKEDTNDDWEKLLEEEDELHNLVMKTEVSGSITIMKKTHVYEDEENIGEKDSNDSSIIEIYDFPEEFKTQDLYATFSPYVNRGFQLKWVDNTHALGIFPSPVIADEVLSSGLPFVKIRALNQATPQSKEKAKNLILPSSSRPKTCSALARRLVSGALGLRAVFTQDEIQKEKQMLKEAREQKRLAAKQRDAAWEGKF